MVLNDVIGLFHSLEDCFTLGDDISNSTVQSCFVPVDRIPATKGGAPVEIRFCLICQQYSARHAATLRTHL